MPKTHSKIATQRLTAAILAGTFLLVAPAGAGSHDPIAAVQQMADRAKVINVAMDGLSVADDWHYHVTRTLLSHYGEYSRFEDDFARSENRMLFVFGEDTATYVSELRRDLDRTTSATANDQAQFDALLTGIEALGAAGMEVHEAIEQGRIDDANTIYWQRIDPAYKAVIRAAYTIRNNHGRAITIEAMKLR